MIHDDDDDDLVWEDTQNRRNQGHNKRMHIDFGNLCTSDPATHTFLAKPAPSSRVACVQEGNPQ